MHPESSKNNQNTKTRPLSRVFLINESEDTLFVINVINFNLNLNFNLNFVEMIRA